MSTLQNLADRLDINDLLTRYTVAVDRCDAALFASIWASGAIVDYGDGPQDAATWSAGLMDRLGLMERTQHTLANIVIKVTGDAATTQTVCTAYHRVVDAAGARAIVVGGRYLDRLRRTAEGWRIAERRYVMDWNETFSSNCAFGEGMFARFGRLGARWPDDPSYHAGDA